MKTVLFVPGFQESLKSRDYKSTIAAIASKGYDVQFVPIRWARTTISDWVSELDTVYAKYDPDEIILAGFSYGSMTAFLSAAKRNPSELWLFSLSPYFSDDIPNIKKSWLDAIGHRRADAFRRLAFTELAENIRCKTLIIVGSVEAERYPLVGQRASKANAAIGNSTLVIAQGSNHDVTDENYIEAIRKAI